jgi:hypothetical protein
MQIFHNLNISSGYGPYEEDPTINRTLLFIFCSGMVHKEKFTIHQQAGVQQHCDYPHCSVFATEILVILKLFKMTGQLKFSHNNWFTISLTNFETQEHMWKGILVVLKSAGISDPAKIIHH